MKPAIVHRDIKPAKLCTRCSMSSDGFQLCQRCYEERAKHVYWDKGKACRAGGANHRECLLEGGHDGPHEGNGFDDYGPLSRTNWWP